jgi:hypothetical protein
MAFSRLSPARLGISFSMRGFLFNNRCFKVTVRANPELLSASIHYLHFFIARSFLALVAFQDALRESQARAHSASYWANHVSPMLHHAVHPQLLRVGQTNLHSLHLKDKKNAY